MIKQDWMVIVAGHKLVDQMEAEHKAKVEWTGRGYNSEQLRVLQRDQSARGIIGIELVDAIRGWSVRYDSGLQDFGLLRRSDDLGGSLEAAMKYATDWVAQDPGRRYAWRRKTNEERVAA